jgi:hypothetical protein
MWQGSAPPVGHVPSGVSAPSFDIAKAETVPSVSSLAAYTTGRVGWLATKDGDGVGVGSPTTRSAPVPGTRAATVRPTPAPPVSGV